MNKGLTTLITATAIAMSTSAFGWSIEGKVDIIDLRSSGTSYIYVAPKTSLPSHRWLIRSQVDRCNDLATDALSDGTTVLFQGSGTCTTTGTIRRCPNTVTRCLGYRNR